MILDADPAVALLSIEVVVESRGRNDTDTNVPELADRHDKKARV